MTIYLFFSAIIMLICVLFHKLSNRIGIPVLLVFMLLGMIFGSDGIVKIPFDDFVIAEQICSIALIFIIFYGGFGTRWSEARPIALKAVLLSSIGTILTAVFVGVFCYYILHIDFLESLLIGAVLCSTDAASVFSILRSKRLNLRYQTASLLELESGSNDSFSYMLTMMALYLMNGGKLAGSFFIMFLNQILFGVLLGIVVAWISLHILKKIRVPSSNFYAIFIIGSCLLCYSLSTLLGGNGYLAVYLTGILLGNNKWIGKEELVHFFDGVTGMAQMLLFFLLGLLSFPSQLVQIIMLSLSIALFLTFIARPLAVFLILTPFKSKLSQQLVVSWCGLRGAASIVFAIMAVIDPASTNHDIFHIVFFIVLFSIAIQGFLLPIISKKLNMTDEESNVLQTFNDFAEDVPLQFIQITIPKKHPWANKKIKEIIFPPESLIVLILRNQQQIIPDGNVILQEDDIIIMCGNNIEQTKKNLQLYERIILKDNRWIGKTISDIHQECPFILMIKRNQSFLIPNGSTVLEDKDILVHMEQE